MTRVNKTVKNLQLVWKQLDDSCGALENALFNIAMMVDMPDELKKTADEIDFSALVSLKNEVEDLIEAKKDERQEKLKESFDKLVETNGGALKRLADSDK